MDDARGELLERMFVLGRTHDATEPERGRQYRNLEPDSARLLHMMLRGRRSVRALEIGTSNGYSTIWLADALGAEARLVSVDNDEQRHAEADKNLTAAGLRGRVELVLGDAADVLGAMAPASVDFLFLDADRSRYASYWPDIRRIMTAGGLVAVDNCTSHAEEVAEFRRLVDADHDVASLLVPLGAGLLLVDS